MSLRQFPGLPGDFLRKTHVFQQPDGVFGIRGAGMDLVGEGYPAVRDLLAEMKVVVLALQQLRQLDVVGGHDGQAVMLCQVAKHRAGGGDALLGVGSPQDFVHDADGGRFRGQAVDDALQIVDLFNIVAFPGQNVVPQRHGGDQPVRGRVRRAAEQVKMLWASRTLTATALMKVDLPEALEPVTMQLRRMDAELLTGWLRRG